MGDERVEAPVGGHDVRVDQGEQWPLGRVDAAPACTAWSQPPWVAHDVGAARGHGSHGVGSGRCVIDDGHRRVGRQRRQGGREAVGSVVGRDDHVDVGDGVLWPTAGSCDGEAGIHETTSEATSAGPDAERFAGDRPIEPA